MTPGRGARGDDRPRRFETSEDQGREGEDRPRRDDGPRGAGGSRRDDRGGGRAGRDAGYRPDDRPGRGERPRRDGGYRRDDTAGREDRPRREGGYRKDDRVGREERPRRDDRSGGGGPRDDRRRSRPGTDRGRPAGPDRHGSRDRDAAVPEHNPGDLRSANRADRAKSPEIDGDITGKELDRATNRELDSLDERNRPWVAKHLVMAGRLLEIDPGLSFEHALAASRRGGRLGCVREAVGLTAYAAGHYADALREFRTYRRITGDNTHLPEMVDSERALGRHAKALELAGEVDHRTLDRAVRVELLMVLSGVHRDLGDLDSALSVLEVPELDRNRGFSFSPRLFRAYADALDDAGRGAEARDWRHQARVAERALGIGEFADPEIVDFGLEDVEDDARPERRPRARDLVPPGATTEGADRGAGTSHHSVEDGAEDGAERDQPVGEGTQAEVRDDQATAEQLPDPDQRDD